MKAYEQPQYEEHSFPVNIRALVAIWAPDLAIVLAFNRSKINIEYDYFRQFTDPEDFLRGFLEAMPKLPKDRRIREVARWQLEFEDLMVVASISFSPAHRLVVFENGVDMKIELENPQAPSALGMINLLGLRHSAIISRVQTRD